MRYKVDFAAIENDDIQESEEDLEDYF